MVHQTSGAAGVKDSTASSHGAGAGSSPSAALQYSSLFGPKEVLIRFIPTSVAKQVCETKHYLGSYPGGSLLNFGSFVGDMLLGVAVLGVGPANLHRLFRDAEREQVLCLTRFWLDDRLGRNSESRALAMVLRLLRTYQSTAKAVVAYADPLAGHTGTIYRASGFLYLGESSAMPLYRLPDGSVHHSRSLSHRFGTHSRRHFSAHGIDMELVPQARKLIYVALIDPGWRERLTRPLLKYRKEGKEDGDR